jgi:MoaA/NifB/PqqE/SkfB family radical SAM enzyme
VNAIVDHQLNRARLAWLWASRDVDRFARPPQSAQIEVTNRCNLSCRTCTRLKLPEQGDMSLDDFKRMIDSLGHLDRLWLSGQGEPLLHPDLPEMVRYCTEKGITNTVIHTSGMPLSHETAERLAISGLGELRVSIDGGTPEEMEFLRVGASLDEVIENTRAFVACGTVRTSFYTVLNRRNHASVPLLPGLAASIGVETIYVVETVPFRDETTEREIYDRREYQFAALPEETRRRTLAKIRENGERHGVDVRIDLKWYRRRCFDPFRKIYVDFRGNVTPCCRIHNEVFVGNVVTDGLEGSWFSTEMARWRHDLLRRDSHRRICIERCNLGIGQDRRRNV